MQQDRAQGLFVQARARMLLEAGGGLKELAFWGSGSRGSRHAALSPMLSSSAALGHRRISFSTRQFFGLVPASHPHIMLAFVLLKLDASTDMSRVPLKIWMPLTL